MLMKQVMVKKLDGSIEAFDISKLQNSLRNARASSPVVDEVTEHMMSKIKDGMSTTEIYRMAFREMRRVQPGAALRYNLKTALFKLGPEGYPFETFMGALLKGRGYSTLLRQNINGKCVNHEIDIIAERPAMNGKAKKKCTVECKFHNSMGIYCRIQTALYSWARYLDIKEQNKDITEGWLVTNTKFSLDSIQYSNCVGLKLLGWSFPRAESLQVRVSENKLYPITILPSLDKRELSALHNAEIILVPELAKEKIERLSSLGIQQRKAETLIEEAKQALSSKA
jgi:hypothetical protein